MATFKIAYTPPQLRHAPRNWYVSPHTQSSPIVVFNTQEEAIEYARSLPQEYSAGIYTNGRLPLPVTIDWIHAPDTAPLTFQISRTRPIEDRRSPRHAIH